MNEPVSCWHPTKNTVIAVLSTSVRCRPALICRAFSWVVTPSDVSIIVVFIVIISVVVSADIVIVVLTWDWDVFRSFDVTVTEAVISDSCHSSYPEEDDVLMTNFVSSVAVDDVSDDSPNFHLVILSRSPFERSAARWFSVIDRLLIVTCDITLFESLVTSLWNASRQVILDECCGCRRQLFSSKKKKRLYVLSWWTGPSSHHSEQISVVTQRCSYAILWTLSRTWRIVVRTADDLIGLDRGRWSHLRKEKLNWIFVFFQWDIFQNFSRRTPQARRCNKMIEYAIVRQRRR